MALIDEQWVVFRLAGNTFGLSIKYVKEMTLMGGINKVPQAPNFVMGAMRLRNSIVPMIDLRVRLGLPSMKQERDEVIQLMHDREDDHVRWLKELKVSVKEKKEFTLARDPHKCAFGRWYDQFHTSDMILYRQLKKFETPHREIHQVADRALNLENRGLFDEAVSVIEQAENKELALMIQLFAKTREVIQERISQIALFMIYEERLCGLAVDEILSVARIKPDHISPPPPLTQGIHEKYLLGMARPENNKEALILLLDARSVALGVEATT